MFIDIYTSRFSKKEVNWGKKFLISKFPLFRHPFVLWTMVQKIFVPWTWRQKTSIFKKILHNTQQVIIKEIFSTLYFLCLNLNAFYFIHSKVDYVEILKVVMIFKILTSRCDMLTTLLGWLQLLVRGHFRVLDVVKKGSIDTLIKALIRNSIIAISKYKIVATLVIESIQASMTQRSLI